MELGDLIRDLRQQKGLTLEQVGDAVGVGKSTVRKWETGDIRNMGRDKIAKLARILGTTPDYLINCGEASDPWSQTFRDSLLSVLARVDATDAKEVGLDTHKWNAIATASSPLSLHDACEFCDITGYSLDDMVGKENEKKPVAVDGLSEAQIQLIELAKNVPEEKAEKVLAMLKLLLEAD